MIKFTRRPIPHPLPLSLLCALALLHGRPAAAGTIAVTNEADARLAVFAPDGGFAIKRLIQTRPNGGSFGGWQEAGQAGNTVAAARNHDGALELFVIGNDHALWHQRESRPNGPWGAWASLGGWIDQLDVARDDDGRLEVFARGADRALYHICQKAPDGKKGWGTWEKLGGPIDGVVAA